MENNNEILNDHKLSNSLTNDNYTLSVQLSDWKRDFRKIFNKDSKLKKMIK